MVSAVVAAVVAAKRETATRARGARARTAYLLSARGSPGQLPSHWLDTLIGVSSKGEHVITTMLW
jgi:hypothetical protein